jgi:RNA ligase
MASARKTLKEIESIDDIQQLALSGFDHWTQYGDVHVSRRGDLLLFDYTTAAHVANRWNFFERVSRGLIINRQTGEIVARPFDKFFHWLSGRKPRGHIITVTEKVDGSLGILFRHKGEHHIATKGSFFSPQARWATKFLNDHFDLSDLPDELTLLFEIVYPDNRIVVDYGKREDLVLLAARNRFTSEFLPFFPDVYDLSQRYGFSLPQVYNFNSIDDIIAQTGRIDANFEGWVVEFSDGSRFKFKMDEYVEIHKLLRGLDFPTILKEMAKGNMKHIMETVPDAFLGETKVWVKEIQGVIEDIFAQTAMLYAAAPKDSREAFVYWVERNHPTLKPYLMAMYEQRALEPVIYELAFQERLLAVETVR